MPHVDRTAEPWGTRTPDGPGQPWPVRVDQHLAEGVAGRDVDRRLVLLPRAPFHGGPARAGVRAQL